MQFHENISYHVQMEEKMQVSVIVPVYKVEKYIKRCLNSIVNQTYRDLEIILVDDGSPDNCGKICDEYAKQDSRIKVLHQENGGQSKARNEAMKIAKGDYFCFVDSDDYIATNMIERLVSLAQHNQADISMIDYTFFSGEQADVAKQNEDKCLIFTNVELIKNMHTVPGELYVVMWGKLFKRELFEGITFPEGRICEDLAILYKLYDQSNKAVYSAEVLYYYYRNNVDSSTFQIKDKFYTDVFNALDEEITYMEHAHADLVEYPRKTYLYWIFDYYRGLWKEGNKENKGKMKMLLKKYRALFKLNRGLKKDKFYSIFYYVPNLYLALKER